MRVALVWIPIPNEIPDNIKTNTLHRYKMLNKEISLLHCFDSIVDYK